MRALSLLVVLCGFASAFVTSGNHDLVLGQATYGDFVIYKTNEHKYGFPLIVRTTEIDYPLPGQQSFVYIRAIYVKDHYYDGTGGYAAITAGGVGQKFVRIKLKSQRGYGFNFTVTIYGRY